MIRKSTGTHRGNGPVNKLQGTRPTRAATPRKPEPDMEQDAELDDLDEELKELLMGAEPDVESEPRPARQPRRSREAYSEPRPAASRVSQKQPARIFVPELDEQHVTASIVGATALYLHKLGETSAKELLAPSGRKTGAQRALVMKHNPPEEYREAMERLDNGPTALGIKCAAFKAAMMESAVRQRIANSVDVAQLILFEEEYVPLFGVPTLKMDVVRMSDRNHTPDIRTRPFLVNWAVTLRFSFIRPWFTTPDVIQLLKNAGRLVGVGDYRPQKGAGNFGRFHLVPPDDVGLADIVTAGGRKYQETAIDNPAPADDYTRRLLTHWQARRDARAR